jgi:antirestriction protein ArdC
MKLHELYAQVTSAIIKDLEGGVATWVKPWKSGAKTGIMPYNAVTGRQYRGINIPILWHARQTRGYPTAGWLTYRQALPLDAHVRKGEVGTTVVFTRQLTINESKEDDEARCISMLRAYTVFNEAQIEGLPKTSQVELIEYTDEDALAFINATQARINHGGNRAYYMPAMDLVWLPSPNDFESYEHYLATALHELAHWSGAKHRLDRQLSNRFGTQAYAAEELVAELSAAFLCAHLNIEGKLRHAEYIANWLELLREDPRAIFTAASKASQAADFLRSFSEVAEEAA